MSKAIAKVMADAIDNYEEQEEEQPGDSSVKAQEAVTE